MNWAAAEQRCSNSRGAPSLLEVRAERLQRGLASLGIGPGDEVAVACCDQHLPDRLVALASLEHLGAVAVVPSEWTHSAIGEIAQTHRKAMLACEQGVAAWRDVRGRGVLIGEANNVLWWKGLECRHSHIDSAVPAESA
jgi:hypothetical protein